jgi:hypothetical protein
LAANDQQRMWTWTTVAVPMHYAYTLRRNEVRRLETSAEVR